MNRKKIALVTGASFGIGSALVRELIDQNWIVIGIARSIEPLMAIHNELGHAFIPVICDISQISDIRSTCQDILCKDLCPSLFFLNAGIAGEQALENPNEFKIDIHQRIMAVNYFGVLAFVECFEKSCLKNGGGSFIVTSSVNAIFAPPTGSAYCASKAAISKAFESLSLTYWGKNLKFLSIYAGPVSTDGLMGRLPFTWTPKKMAHYMITLSERKKLRGYPSFFYWITCHILRILPDGVVMRILRGISNK